MTGQVFHNSYCAFDAPDVVQCTIALTAAVDVCKKVFSYARQAKTRNYFSKWLLLAERYFHRHQSNILHSFLAPGYQVIFVNELYFSRHSKVADITSTERSMKFGY